MSDFFIDGTSPIGISHKEQAELIKKIGANVKLGLKLANDIQNKRGAEELDVLKCIKGLIDCVQKSSMVVRDIHTMESRRKDQWDVLASKLKNDPMFEETWNELLMLMKLEEPNI